MEYSEENLVKLIDQASHQARQGKRPESTGKAGYPDCPGPGCGNNCPYKGTQECPKVSAGNAGNEKRNKGHGQGMRHGHGGHGWHGDSQWHGKDGGGQGIQNPMGRERILTLLEEAGTVSQRKLAEELAIRPQSVSELLVKLEKDGYITRTPNEQDKREILVALSDEGEKRAGEVKDMEDKQTTDFLAPLDEEERKTLFALLTKLTTNTARN